MRIRDIASDRIAITEAPYSLWQKAKTSAGAALPFGYGDKHMADAVRQKTASDIWKIYKRYARGGNTTAADMRKFFQSIHFGVSGDEALQRYDDGEELSTEAAQEVIRRVTNLAYKNNPEELARRSGIPEVEKIGFEDEKKAKDEKLKAEKEKARSKEVKQQILTDLIERMDEEFRNIIRQSGNEDLRNIRFQAYSVFKQVASKFGKPIEEPATETPEPPPEENQAV